MKIAGPEGSQVRQKEVSSVLQGQHRRILREGARSDVSGGQGGGVFVDHGGRSESANSTT